GLVLVVRIHVQPNGPLGEPGRRITRDGEIADAAALLLRVRRHIRPPAAEVDAHRRSCCNVTHGSARTTAREVPSHGSDESQTVGASAYSLGGSGVRGGGKSKASPCPLDCQTVECRP